MIAVNQERVGALQANMQAAAHELVRRNTARGGDTQEDIAVALGIERGRLSQLLNKPGENIPIHLAVQLTRTLRDDYLIQAICDACGGQFLPHSKEPMAPSQAQRAFANVMALLGDAMRESGEALAVTTEVIRDRVATSEEKARARREILETISALGLLLQAITAMPERTAAPFTTTNYGEKF